MATPSQLLHVIYLSQHRYNTFGTEMREWCERFCKERAYFGTNWSRASEYNEDAAIVVNFTTEEDATLFTLKWK
jgi:hypothetical protein